MRPRLTFWGRMSLRSRLLLIGSGGLAVGFALGGVVLVAVLGYALQRGVDTDALSTARGVAALVDAGALPQPVPVSGGQIVQVVDAQGRVRSASIGADRLIPLLPQAELAEARNGRRTTLDGSRVGVTGPLRVVAERAGPAADPQTVIVARPISTVRESVVVVRTVLLIAYPLLIAVLALLARRVVGVALRPVEQLRAGAAAITAGTLDEAATRRSAAEGWPGSGAEAGAAGNAKEAGPGSGAKEAGPGSGAKEAGPRGARPAPGLAGDRLPVPDSQDEIHRLAVTLNDMLDRLAAARARQRAFVADAAHELRSPLANMRTELEVAQRIGDPPNVDDLLLDLDRLTRLVDDLLLLARSDEGRVPACTELIDVGALLRETAEHFAAARVPVTVVGDAAGWASGDPMALRHVLTNLVDNAVRHASSRVTLIGTPGGFAVVDDGPGIAPTDRERVFERFTRLDDARARDAGGAGLGLAIVRELVRRHGGTVTLADAKPGLRVQVRLLPSPDMSSESSKGGSPVTP
jgi:signal transduction histidine kinase